MSMNVVALIEQIERILANLDDDDAAAKAPDLAFRLSEISKRVNNRLLQCHAYIKEEKLSEAMRVAREEPALFDMCTQLDFNGAKAWREHCLANMWPVTEPLQTDAVEALIKLKESGGELNELLDEYRRAVQAKNLKKAVQLLRRLKSVDPANKLVQQDLAKFEQRRAEQIAREFDEAAQQGHIDQMALLVTEMEADWEGLRNEELLSSMKKRLQEVYEEDALIRARRLLDVMAQAYQSMDLIKVSNLIRDYRQLLKKGLVKENENMQRQFEEACAWYRETRKKREMGQKMSNTLFELRTRVEKNEVDGLPALLATLQRNRYPIPETLRSRALVLLENKRLAQQRMLIRNVISVIVLMLMLGVVTLFLYQRYAFDRQVACYSQKLHQAYAEQDLVQCNVLMGEIEQRQPRLLETEAIRLIRLGMEELAALNKNKKNAFDQALCQLTDFRQRLYLDVDLDLVRRGIEEASSNAVDDADKQALAREVEAWEDFRAGVRKRRDAECNAMLDEVTDVAGVSGLPDVARIEAINRALPELRGKLEQAAAISDTSEASTQRLNQVQRHIDRLAQWMKHRAELLTVRKPYESLVAYLEALTRYADNYPEDPLTRKIRDVMALKVSYRALAAGPEARDPRDPFWYPVAHGAARFEDLLEEKWPEVKAMFAALKAEKKYVELYVCRYMEDVGVWIKAYFEGKPKRQIVDGISKFAGLWYVPYPEHARPQFEFAQITTMYIKELELTESSSFLKQMISDALFAKPRMADEFLLGAMRKVYENPHVTPLLKVRLIEFLVSRMIDLVGHDNLREWDEFHRDLTSIDQDMHWLCMASLEVQKADKQARELLDKHFKQDRITAVYGTSRLLRKLALQRNVHWVGVVPLSDPRRIVWNSGEEPLETWVVRIEHEPVRAVIMLAREKGGETDLVELKPGEPLFAPQGKHTTRTLFDAIIKHTQLDDVSRIVLPPCWPMNFQRHGDARAP